MSPQEKLASLVLRALRAGRMFLDPQLQLGKVKVSKIFKMYQKIGISKEFIQTEVDRYMYKSPGQAVSYYYGYMKLLYLKQRLQAKYQGNLNLKAFHDKILSIGLVPLELVEDQFMEDESLKR